MMVGVRGHELGVLSSSGGHDMRALLLHDLGQSGGVRVLPCASKSSDISGSGQMSITVWWYTRGACACGFLGVGLSETQQADADKLTLTS
jgi:hypothetical protein